MFCSILSKMRWINHNALILLLCISLRTLRADDNFFELSTSTNSVRLRPNGSVTFSCTVFTSRTDGWSGVQWFRRQGTLSLMTATEVFPNLDFDSSGRYTFERGVETSTTFSYFMKINNLQLQDSATIECGNLRFTKRATLAFAVCDDPQSKSCNCMVDKGWASPECFKYLIDAKEISDGYHRAIIGLGVGLAIAIVIAIVLTVLAVKNCTHSIAASLKDKENSKQTDSPNTPPAMSLASPGVSVLKQPSRTNVPAGHSVRFSEDNTDARNQHIMPELSRQDVNEGARPKDFIPSISGRIYPNLDAVSYPTPGSTAQSREFQQQILPGMNNVYSQDLPSQFYQPHGLQPYVVQPQPYAVQPQPYVVQPQPYVMQPLAVAPVIAGAVHNQGTVFIDPGSTSV